MCFLWCSLVLEVDFNLYGLTTSMCRVGWKVCAGPVPISAVCLIAVDGNPDGWTTDANDFSVIDLGFALSSGKLTLLPQSLLRGVMKYGLNYRPCWRDHLHVRELARSWTRSRARLLKWYLYQEHNKWHKLERWHPKRHQLVDMYTYMHMSVDQQVTKITDLYATVTTYETFGQSTISIETKSEYD
jgi:hypothetical protein